MKGTDESPLIKEVGIATLDTRLLFFVASKASTEGLIETSQFSTSNASKGFGDCDMTDFQECLFAETYLVSQVDIASRIVSAICIKDTISTNLEALRNIILVGHSPNADLRYNHGLGCDFYRIAPIRAVIDTHLIARHLLGPEASLPKDTAPLTNFQLSSVLKYLGIEQKTTAYRNAGNDATFTLFTLLVLAVKGSERRELDALEASHVADLNNLVL